METSADAQPFDDAVKSYLETRRSIPAFRLEEPGPDRSTIMAMLKIASRVPDHGKMTPWRFIVYGGAVRAQIGDRLAEIARTRRPDMSDEDILIERERLTRAPVVIAVVSRAAPHVKIPEWEQILSSGAACFNLFMAANAHGFGANWLTEWYAYDEETLPVLGVAPDERVAGFLHIGTAGMQPADRPRPELGDIVTWAGEGE